MLHKKLYSSHNTNTFTLRDFVSLDNIRNTLPVHEDTVHNKPPLSDKIFEIEKLYTSGKGLFAWDAGIEKFNSILNGDFIAIMFNKINEVFVGRLYYKFFDSNTKFQENVNWRTDYNTKFPYVLLFDEGQYYTNVPKDFLKLINNDQNIDYNKLKNILDGQFVEITNITQPINIPSPLVTETYGNLMNYIYNEKGAIYDTNVLYKNNHNTVNFNGEELRYYLGTYFPRSLKECSSILKDIYNSNVIQKIFKEKNEINILDIGSGTGGNLIGFLLFLQENNLLNKKINILSIDGNNESLDIQKDIISKFFNHDNVSLEQRHWTNQNTKDKIINQLRDDLKQYNNVFDFIMSFKFVNEFYEKTDNNSPLYLDLLTNLEPYMKNDGLILFADITEMVFNSSIYLPIQMSKEIQKYVIENQNRLKTILPLSCAYYQTVNPYHECFKLKIFDDTNPIKNPYDKEKLCFYLLAKPELQEKILNETNISGIYRIAENYINYTECSCGTPKGFLQATDAPDSFSLKESLKVSI